MPEFKGVNACSLALVIRKPITGIAVRCARAGSGHVHSNETPAASSDRPVAASDAGKIPVSIARDLRCRSQMLNRVDRSCRRLSWVSTDQVGARRWRRIPPPAPPSSTRENRITLDEGVKIEIEMAG